ncbi:MAG: hypothetical protein OHK0045_14660 [Raineya sp.]
MKYIFGLVWLVFISLASFSQDFKVLSSQGNNTFKNSQKRIWAGSTLKVSDAINIASGGYLGLMHIKTGKTIELKKSGSYLMSSFVPKRGGNSLVAKYGNFVGEEMIKAEKQDINKNHRKYMAVTGAVTRERAIGGNASQSIILLAKSEETIFNPQTTIHWLAQEGSGKTKYYVLVSNMENEQVAWYETDQTNISIDFSNLKRARDGGANFIVSILDTQSPNRKGILNITWLNKNEYKKIQDEIGDFTPQNALDYMVLAKFFEEKKLNLDALACYQKVLALQNSENYKTAYMEFLVRNQMGYTYEGN